MSKMSKPFDADLVPGFRHEPRFAPDGSVYTGRATLHDVQWTVNPDDVIATCTVTARQLVDMSQTRVIWVDQNVQRGVKPGVRDAPALLPLGDGYPDPIRYIFDAARADDIAEKLLSGDRLFLNPLVWNLRPATFEAYFDEDSRRIHLYHGNIYLPDSHHRHQAVQKAVLLYQETPTDFEHFSEDRQFTVEVYFMSVENEGEYFFEKNQLGKSADRSRAFELTTQDSISAAAKRAIELAPSLRGNVNRVTDRLSARNPQVVTLSTLRSMMRAFVDADYIPATVVDQSARAFAQAYELLAEVRPELSHLSEEDRQTVRKSLLVDQAVMMHGYVRLMKKVAVDIESTSLDEARQNWRQRLNRISKDYRYVHDDWSGDVFDRKNPLWRELGVLQQTKRGSWTVSNTRQTRRSVGDFLDDHVTVVE